MVEISFFKMHGLKNSFIIVTDFSHYLTNNFNLEKIAIEMCSFREGIGADGLVLLKMPIELAKEKYDLEMLIYNADGSEAKMCGNAIRCLAKYIYDQEIVKKKELIFKTKSGLIKTQLLKNTKLLAWVRVNMGRASIFKSELINQKKYFSIGMGNRHLVSVVDNFNFDYFNLAKEIQNHHDFSFKTTNIEFVKILNDREIEIKVIEAGVGETYACGTGACAAAVAVIKNCFIKSSKLTTKLIGGNLEIFWPKQKEVIMTGVARMISQGKYFLAEEKKSLPN